MAPMVNAGALAVVAGMEADLAVALAGIGSFFPSGPSLQLMSDMIMTLIARFPAMNN